MSLEAVRYLVRALGFRKVSPRPLHPEADPQAQEDFRRNFSDMAMSALPEGTDPASVDIWCQDEARIGQKGMLTRVRALRGSRPRVPSSTLHDYAAWHSVSTMRLTLSGGTLSLPYLAAASLPA